MDIRRYGPMFLTVGALGLGAIALYKFVDISESFLIQERERAHVNLPPIIQYYDTNRNGVLDLGEINHMLENPNITDTIRSEVNEAMFYSKKH